MITRKTQAFIIDDFRPGPSDGAKPDDPPEDHGDIATPEPCPTNEDDRPLD